MGEIHIPDQADARHAKEFLEDCHCERLESIETLDRTSIWAAKTRENRATLDPLPRRRIYRWTLDKVKKDGGPRMIETVR